MKTYRTTFYFRKKSQSEKFKAELRKCFILTESEGNFVVHIFEWHKIREDKKDEVSRIAEKVYREIIG